ncbi:hypothetical protein ACFY3U_18745 [Micromonospora sp. NPDC000089]|uniref:hypothetical protein n=1 Tax=unclassified Micromonospora TaxID=2617518 RepID=UPI0036845858
MPGRAGSLTQIAGSVRLDAVMVEVRMSRAVFHSRADLMHAFTWAVRRLDSGVQVRLETRQADDEPYDLLCSGPRGRTAIEFSYCTARWEGRDPGTGERVRLPGTGAEPTRSDFAANVARLERLCLRDPGPMTGLALMLTNDPANWSTPSGRSAGAANGPRIHEGRRSTGTVHQEPDRYAWAARRGTTVGHPPAWREYAHLDGRYAEFRWMAVQVDAGWADARRPVADEPAS